MRTETHMETEAQSAITQEFQLEESEQKFRFDPGALMSVDVAGTSHEGHVRPNNEDHYLVIQFGRSLRALETNLTRSLIPPDYDLTGYGMVVADGLGGMSGGEVASRTALTKLVELVIETPDWVLGLDLPENVETVLGRAKDRFLKIDEALKEKADIDASLSGMGTTLTTAVTLGNNLVLGHVGDSRAYLYRDGNLTQLTKDHTVAQELIDAGLSGTDPVARSMRHVLTAALGSLGARIQPEVRRLRLKENDQLLLCTDGLSDMVDDKTVASLLRNSTSSVKACEDLKTVALAAGGTDNITVVVARFGPPEPM
ncbi:MAG TPA: protein phosphatase 2C domain-containing protein [Pyrinomonadaceae bacterium]|nr:protein phosphatase 2C domain-containing protein [Pyrinomonadaceae bacterium]